MLSVTYTRHAVPAGTSGSRTEVVWGSAANCSCSQDDATHVKVEDFNDSLYLIHVEALTGAGNSNVTDFLTVAVTGTTDQRDENRLYDYATSDSRVWLDENTYLGKFSQLDLTRQSYLKPVLIHSFELIL